MGGNALINAHQLLKMAGVTQGMTVIECGAGHTGHLLFPAAKLVGKAGAVHGISVLPEDIHMINQHPVCQGETCLSMLHGDYFRVGGVPLKGGSVDRIFLVNQLYTIKDLDGFVGEMRRLLGKSGELWMVDWRADSAHPVAPNQQLRVKTLPLERELARRGAKTTPLSLGQHHFVLRAHFP